MSLNNEFVFSEREMPLMSFRRFVDMKAKGSLCDITLCIQNEKIPAHRLVLAANIPYFSDIFLDSARSEVKEITFQMIDINAFKSLIHYAYTCEIKINADNVKSVLIGATLLKMDQICNACTDYILRSLSALNALEIRKFATMRRTICQHTDDLYMPKYCMKLKEAADECVQKYFFEISRSAEFLDLPFLDLKELIGQDELHVICEEEVFQAVIAWVKKSPTNREDKLPELLTSVRMPLLGYHYLSTYVAQEELIKNSSSCLNLLNEALQYCKLPCKMLLPSSFTVKHRNYGRCEVVYENSGTYIYAICRSTEGGEQPTVVIRYDLTAMKWQMMNARNIYIKEAAVVVMNKKLYVIGGCNSIGRMLNTVQVFDPESDSWDKIASLPVKVTEVAAAVCLDKIYVFGGKLEDNSISRYVYCYTPEKGNWDYVGKMHHYRRRACAVAANECVYILGGYGYVGKQEEPLSSVEMYNVKEKAWHKVPPMSMALSHFGATFFSNRVYVYGKEFIEFYDSWIGEWDRISEVRMSTSGLSLLAFRGKLFAVGGKRDLNSSDNFFGQSAGNLLNTFEIYDLKTGKWTKGEALPHNTNFIAAGVITEH